MYWTAFRAQKTATRKHAVEKEDQTDEDLFKWLPLTDDDGVGTKGYSRLVFKVLQFHQCLVNVHGYHN